MAAIGPCELHRSKAVGETSPRGLLTCQSAGGDKFVWSSRPESESADRVRIKCFPREWAAAPRRDRRPAAATRRPNERPGAEKSRGGGSEEGILAGSRAHLDLRALARVCRAKLCDRCSSSDLEPDRNSFISIYVLHAWISFLPRSESPRGQRAALSDCLVCEQTARKQVC